MHEYDLDHIALAAPPHHPPGRGNNRLGTLWLVGVAAQVSHDRSDLRRAPFQASGHSRRDSSAATVAKPSSSPMATAWSIDVSVVMAPRNQAEATTESC